MATMIRRLSMQGFAASAAVAASPGAAWALARHGGGRRRLADDLDLAGIQRIFAPMPLAALRLDETQVARLGQAGLRRGRRPAPAPARADRRAVRARSPPPARRAARARRRADLARVSRHRPSSPNVASPRGIARREDVEGTILLARLRSLRPARAPRRGRAPARRRALPGRRRGAPPRGRHQPAAARSARHGRGSSASASRRRARAGSTTGYGFEMVRLAATAAERLDETQAGWDAAGAGEADVADLVDRLGARFGLERVTRLRLADSHQPERAAMAVSAAQAVDQAVGQAGTMRPGHDRPRPGCGGGPRHPAGATAPAVRAAGADRDDGRGARRAAAALPLAPHAAPGRGLRGTGAHRPGMVEGGRRWHPRLLPRRGHRRPALLALPRRALSRGPPSRAGTSTVFSREGSQPVAC